MTAHNPTSVWRTSHKAVLAAVLIVQFAFAYFAGTGDWLTNDSQSFFAPVALSVAIPVALFFAAYFGSARFRDFVLAQDLRVLTRLQHWRVIGFVFLPLYAFGVLPGVFAWPAGLGDVAVGLMAAVIVARIDRDPNYVTSRGLVWFHVAGLTDFVVAIITAGLTAGAFSVLVADGITSAPLDVWPMNLFPSFIVPIFIILQVVALLKVRALRQQAQGIAGLAPQAA